MNYARQLTSFLLIASFAAGCGDDSPTEVDSGITIDDLVGSWIATANTYTNNANAAESFDMIADGGEVRITMLDGGGTRTWVEYGTFSDEWDAQVTISGNTLSSVPVEAVRGTTVWTFTLIEGVLTMTREDSEWDFTGTSTPVSATEVLTVVRN